MLRRIWQAILNLWQRWFSRKKRRSASIRRNDTKCENLFMQMLHKVALGASRDEINRLLAVNPITQGELVAWLQQFRTKLADSEAPTAELGRRMVQLGTLGIGELSRLAAEIGRELLPQDIPPSPPPPQTSEPPRRTSAPGSPMGGTKYTVAPPPDIDPETINLFSQGVKLYNAGQIEVALDYFDRAIVIAPNYHSVWGIKGNALSDLRQYSEAIGCFDRAIAIEPNFFFAWNGKGEALSNLGQYSEAIACYDRAIAIEPNFLLAWGGKGNALHNVGQYKEAIACFDKAIAIKPRHHIGWSNKGNPLNNLGQYSEAIACYDKALAIEPNFHLAWNNKGNALRNVGQYKEAIACFDRALELTHNQYWEGWANRGTAVSKVWGYDAALENYDRGLAAILPTGNDEGCGVLYHWKGKIHYRYRRRQENPYPYCREARHCYHQAQKFLAQPRFRVRYLELLQDLAKVCGALGEVDEDARQEAQTVSDEAIRNLETLLEELPEADRLFYLRKFAGLYQLQVDALVRDNPVEALELAERQKNLGLRWMREQRGIRHTASASYEDMQQLLAADTAILYWHVSPIAITAFILKSGQPLGVRVLTGSLTSANRHLQQFEEWMTRWKQQYRDYGEKGKSEEGKAKTAGSGHNHPWRTTLPEALAELSQILEIERLFPQLQDISHLILIPDRDLHLLPLESLFPQWRISRLPTAQIGLELPPCDSRHTLLMAENPEGLWFPRIEAAAICKQYDSRRATPLTADTLTRELLAGADIFHFTGHANHDTTKPDRSTLGLGNGESLTLRNLFDLPNFPRYAIAILSACETGVTSKEDLIDEFIGFPSFFLANQTPYVLCTLWQIEELSSAIIAIAFHQHLNQGMNPLDALQQAQQFVKTATNGDLARFTSNLAQELHGECDEDTLFFLTMKAETLEESDNIEDRPYQHPYYWAAFTLYGR